MRVEYTYPALKPLGLERFFALVLTVEEKTFPRQEENNLDSVKVKLKSPVCFSM